MKALRRASSYGADVGSCVPHADEFTAVVAVNQNHWR